MGTRSLTCVVVDGEYKVAQYCQWDGYPEGQGSTIYNFLKETDLESFKEKVKDLNVYTEEEIQKIINKIGHSNGSFTTAEAEILKRRYPELHRSTGANILSLIRDGQVTSVSHILEFANDSLFCEWAYVVDLDKNKLEVYRGYNKEPLDKRERFYTGETPKPTHDGTLFYPIRHLVSFELDNLPPTVKHFVSICKNLMRTGE